jgi:hypothetical protein
MDSHLKTEGGLSSPRNEEIRGLENPRSVFGKEF